MKTVQIYIEGQRIELFEDEKININLSVQNVQDIAKIFTEFTQSFTVPATPYNNDIFQHFYENAVDTAQGVRYNYQERKPAKIEIDLIPFRSGQIQLEKANVKNGRVESYSITFYGEMVTLKDIFGEDKLNVLDYSAYSHQYTGAEVVTRVTSSSNYNVRYPLISSARYWEYGVGGNQDISITSGHIHYTELFPALKVSRIFAEIENHYGIEFDSLFFNNKRFDNLYLWLKNKDVFEFFTESQVLDIGTLLSSSNAVEQWTTFFNQANDSFSFKTNTGNSNAFVNGFWEQTHRLEYKVQNISDITARHYLEVYKNGQIFAVHQGVGLSAWTVIETKTPLQISGQFQPDVYTFKIYTDKTCNIHIYFNYVIGGQTQLLPRYEEITYTVSTTQNALTNNLDITSNLPDIKIYDFVSGIFKQFNLTCTPFGKDTFKVETLETWYAIGRLIDVTEYIDIDSIDIERVKLFKKISFTHEKSDNVRNYQIRNQFSREYGDLDEVFNYDGSDYTVALPYETMRHQKFTGTQLQVGYSWDKDQQPIIPKCLVLYMNDQKPCSFYLNNGTSNVHVLNYMPFGQDLEYQSEIFSLNFGMDTSTLYDVPILNNIYNVYYRNYIENLYNAKQRLTYVKAVFPTALLTSLRLNDRLIIRDKRYIINDMKVELTTGEVNLVLLHDFRLLDDLTPQINLFGGETSAEVLVPFPENVISATFNAQGSGIISSPTTLTSSGVLNITVPSTNEVENLAFENGDDVIYEDSVVAYVEDYPFNIYLAPTVDFTLSNGSIVPKAITINQQGVFTIVQ